VTSGELAMWRGTQIASAADQIANVESQLGGVGRESRLA
jgi:hypothetical protein